MIPAKSATWKACSSLLLAIAVATGGCASQGDDPGADPELASGKADCVTDDCPITGANPSSPAIPDSYVTAARSSWLVAVAGANVAAGFKNDIAAGVGSIGNPFRRVQSMEAVASLMARAGTPERPIFAWGFGDGPDPAETYYYLGLNGNLHELYFLNRQAAAVGNGEYWNYTREDARGDAINLMNAAKGAFFGDPVIFVGHSWGAAIVDVGFRQDAAEGGTPILRGSANRGLALAGPRQLPSTDLLTLGASFSDDGDHGTLWVARRPDDPVGQGGLKPLRGIGVNAFHNYTMVHHLGDDGERLPGGFWGVTGKGVLCPAVYPDNCP